MNSKPLAASCALIFVAVFVFGVLAWSPAQAGTFKSLYSFTGGTDGGDPYDAPILDSAGNLYGTAFAGGSTNLGVVFKLDPAGKETVLYNFTGSDGANPFGGLLRDQAGNLYGTTPYGGTYSSGVVFKLDTAGKETVLYAFQGGTSDGCYPFSRLVQDKSGNLYGTTAACGTYNYGTVFKLDSKGKTTILHSFAGGSADGEYPYYETPLLDKQGNVYGVTDEGGGTGCGGKGCGVVWKVSAKGKETILHSFAGGTGDGCYPYGTVALDERGNLYGAAGNCGASDDGTVWKISAKGKETTLHNFAGTDGSYPLAGVILDSKGNLYGSTNDGETGCSSGCGVLWKLSAKGKETTLHNFDGTDGQLPWGSLFRDNKGSLYGTTVEGGSNGYGTVWQIK